MIYNVLDLFCGAGGAAIGIEDAFLEQGLKAEILGIDYDYTSRHNYPYKFLFRDLKLIENNKKVINLPASFFRDSSTGKAKWHFIWCSPPCQAHSWATANERNQGVIYEDLTQATRLLMERLWKFYKIPSVIENVPQAPMRADDRLVGDMFDLRIIRRRHFEVRGFTPKLLPIPQKRRDIRYLSIAGHSWGSWDQWKRAMGIHHIHYPEKIKERKHILAQCVPPAYSKKLTLEMIQQCLLN